MWYLLAINGKGESLFISRKMDFFKIDIEIN